MFLVWATLNVKVSGCKVAIVPVGVYVGNLSTAICRLANEAGDKGFLPSPSAQWCQHNTSRLPRCKIAIEIEPTTLYDMQVPIALRG